MKWRWLYTYEGIRTKPPPDKNHPDKSHPDKNPPGHNPSRTKTLPDKNHPIIILYIAITDICTEVVKPLLELCCGSMYPLLERLSTGIQKNGSTNIILILSKIVNGTPYAGMWTSNKWTEGVVPCLTYIVGSGFITNCDLMNVPQFRWEHWWDPAHLHWRNDTIRTCWALDSAIRSWDVGWIKVIDERFKTIRCVFLEIVHSFWNIRYRQECQAVEHPAEELHVVIRAIQRHKSKLLHFAPRTLGEMIKATSALNVRSEGIADSVDGSLSAIILGGLLLTKASPGFYSYQ